jgi:hypothetical protein
MHPMGRLPVANWLRAQAKRALAPRDCGEKYMKRGEDLTGAINDNINGIHDIFSSPPTGSYEGVPGPGPLFTSPQHSGMDAGTGATALFALGLAIDRGATWAMRHLIKHSEGD